MVEIFRRAEEKDFAGKEVMLGGGGNAEFADPLFLHALLLERGVRVDLCGKTRVLTGKERREKPGS